MRLYPLILQKTSCLHEGVNHRGSYARRVLWSARNCLQLLVTCLQLLVIGQTNCVYLQTLESNRTLCRERCSCRGRYLAYHPGGAQSDR